MRRGWSVVAVAVLGATACGGEKSAAAKPDGMLTGEWRSTSVEQKAAPPAPLVAADRVNLLFLSGGRVFASARCNTVSAPYSVEDGRLVMTDPAMTIKTTATALDDGRIGDTITVENTASQKTLGATVARDGGVEIRF